MDSSLVVDLADARTELEAGRARLFDVREPHEHATGVIAGASLLPMSVVGERYTEIPNDPAVPVLLICRTQNRSQMLAHALRERGWDHVRYVHGGMSMWAAQGWPMVLPPRA
jgi:rhodanese-related sulfurtransferase